MWSMAKLVALHDCPVCGTTLIAEVNDPGSHCAPLVLNACPKVAWRLEVGDRVRTLGPNEQMNTVVFRGRVNDAVMNMGLEPGQQWCVVGVRDDDTLELVPVSTLDGDREIQVMIPELVTLAD